MGSTVRLWAGASVKRKVLCLLTVQIGVVFHLQNDFRYRFISPVADSFNVNAADCTHGEDRVRIQELPWAHHPMWEVI